MRKFKAVLQQGCEALVHRVLGHSEISTEWSPDLRFLIPIESPEEHADVLRLQQAGLSNVAWTRSTSLERGDVVVPHASKGEISVLLRESDTHHALFMTNRCNSHCLMCSQPPTTTDDGWLVAEALDAIRHLRKSPRALGLTGGEPLLLGPGLRSVLDAVAQYHPRTQVEVLTNGRLLSQPQTASRTLEGLAAPVRWLVPLYGHADFVHDFVVQASGAFDETLA